MCSSDLNEQVEPLTITVNGQGQIYIQESEVAEDQLVPRLQAIVRNKADQRIFVRGDKAINYGRVMEVMGLVSSAGFDKVALIAEMPQSQQPATPPARGTQPQRRTN